MSIMIATVILFLQEFTTIEAAATLVSDYSIGVIDWTESGTQKQAIIAYKLAGTGYSYRMTIDASIKSPYTIINGKKSGKHYSIIYNSTLDDIIIDQAFADYTRNGNTSYYYFYLGNTSDISNITWYGNQDDLYGANTYKPISDVDLPQGITIDDVNQAINDSLNKTTNTTIVANNIQNTINNYYTSYENGGITKEEMQAAIDNAISQLNDLSDNSGNTLADLMAINNALTYAQTVQDELLLKPSTSVITSVQTILQQVSNLVQQYQNGTVAQAEAMKQLREYAYQLSQLMSGDLTISDVEAINTGTNVVNNFINVIANSNELNKNVSDKAQQSDSDELDYLDSLETTSTISDLAPSKKMQTQAQSSGIQSLLSVVWDNELIKIVLPLTAGFLVVAVALGRKFKL